MNIFIGCSKEKADHPTTAEKLYTSTIFKRALHLAKKIVKRKGGHIYVLSAKHHLLELDDIVEPYNETLAHSSASIRKDWSKVVLNQMTEKGIDFNEETIFFAGDSYIKYIIKYFPNSIEMYSHLTQGYIQRMFSQLYTNVIKPYKHEPPQHIRELLNTRIKYIRHLSQ